MPEQPASIGENQLREVRKQESFWSADTRASRRSFLAEPRRCPAACLSAIALVLSKRLTYG
jgi:hypothetical protein